MQISVLSINHTNAPLEIRETVTFSPEKLKEHLKSLNNINEINSCAILSTCNRTEIYIASEVKNLKNTLLQWLNKAHKINDIDLAEYSSYHTNYDAVVHMFAVASGLSSLVIGEPQILGQLKDAYHTAKKNKTLDKTLEKLFQHTFLTAKKIRTETKIGSSPVSVAYCAVKLAEKIFADIANQTVLLIGAGEMIELAAQHLHNKNIKNLIVANRTIERSEHIANLYNGKSINLTKISKYIHLADIVISSTASPVPILGKGVVETALKERKHKPMLMLDIAVPRDIEKEVGQLDDVYLYTIDDLKQVVETNLQNRHQEKILAEEIIEQQSNIFNHWLLSLPNEIIIQNYRNQAYEIKENVVKAYIKKLENGADEKEVLLQMADILTNKLIHNPSKSLKQNSWEEKDKALNVAKQLLLNE